MRALSDRQFPARAKREGKTPPPTRLGEREESPRCYTIPSPFQRASLNIDNETVVIHCQKFYSLSRRSERTRQTPEKAGSDGNSFSPLIKALIQLVRDVFSPRGFVTNERLQIWSGNSPPSSLQMYILSCSFPDGRSQVVCRK